jgi:pimeloyl-ACP methyl ester carboxylesterase
LAFDYRGFGLSTGTPTEEGLIKDGIAAVAWAMDIAKVPRHKIVLVGQSLGTAVLSAVAEYYVIQEVEFAGVILVAGFTNLTNLLLTYSIAGYIPIIGPLRIYSKLYQLFVSYLLDKWPSNERLANFVRLSTRLRLTIIHAVDDFEIPWTHSEALFAIAANATMEKGMDQSLLVSMKRRATVNVGDGAFTTIWNTGNNKIVREDIVAYGCKHCPNSIRLRRLYTNMVS